jgi:6,7-dimethyl-8-ribityllumazine synthase
VYLLKRIEPKAGVPLSGSGLSVGIVVGQFNNEIAERMRDACEARLKEIGVTSDKITCVGVPGALEIPIVLRAMALRRQYDALIALGSVIRGETYHFEVVSNESSRGVMAVQLETSVPIANGILTCENQDQISERMVPKARECADVAVGMANLLEAINER